MTTLIAKLLKKNTKPAPEAAQVDAAQIALLVRMDRMLQTQFMRHR